jgi:probable phosphoglycerate mutase
LVWHGTDDEKKIVLKYPTIYLLRHGQTEWNVEGRYQGQMDSPLTLKGKEQAKANALKLEKYLNPKEVNFYISPLGRAKSTALIIAEELNLLSSNIFFEKNIQEFNYGVFEGKTKVYCRTKLQTQYEAREAKKWSYVLEGGESYEMVTIRLKAWLETVKNQEIIVIIAHEMINRALRGLYLNLNNKKTLTLFQENDVLIKLENDYEQVLY